MRIAAADIATAQESRPQIIVAGTLVRSISKGGIALKSSDYARIALETVRKNIPSPGSKIDRKHTMGSVAISEYTDEVGIHLKLETSIVEHPGLTFVYDKVVLLDGVERMDPETEAIIFASGFEEALLFHPKSLPESGKVIL